MNFWKNLFSGVSQFKFLWFLMLLYIIIILMANWYNARIVQFLSIATDAGTMIFPITFMVSNLITEVYGYKFARKAIWFGFLFNIAFIIYGLVITHMDSPDFAVDNHMFDKIFSMNIWIIVASFVSYWCSEPTNSYVMAKMKLFTHGRFIWFRFVFSTVVASFFDSIIFTHIAFSRLFDYETIWLLILAMWLVKVIIEIAGLLISIPAATKLKDYEGVDRYDIGTKFAIFSTECKYLKETNKYNEL